MTAIVRNTIEGDIAWIASRLRQADRDEVDAGFGRPPEDAMMFGWKMSTICKTILINGSPMVILGVWGNLGGQGNLWMLATTETIFHKKTFYNLVSEWVFRLSCAFPLLYNYIDDRNQDSKTLAKHLGAKLFDPEPYGIKGLPFRKFEIRRDAPCASPSLQ